MKRILYTVLLLAMATKGTQAQKTISSWNKNQVIAHRGAFKKNNLPENSIASLKHAIALKCYGSEFDVHMTLDSILVVNHDHDFYKLPIAKSTYKQLLEKKHPNGESIPTLEEYLKTGMKQKKTKLILEIKPSNLGSERDIATTERSLQMVKKLKAEAWVDYISFGYDICTYIIKNMPGAHVSYLRGEVTPEQLKKDGFKGVDYHFSVYQQNPDYIERFKKLGISVNGWTANTPSEIGFLLANDAEFITTNEPELAFEMAKKSPKTKGWKLVWSDEFGINGLPNTKNWGYDVGGTGWGNNEKQFYTNADTANAVVKGGFLNITARKADKDKSNFTSARLTSKNKFDWKYGRMEVRALLPKGKGLWPAIWMLPTEWKYGGWPKSGEIDVMEHVGYSPDTVHGTVHTQSFNHSIGTQVGKAIKVDELGAQYHVYALEWYEDRIDLFVDDVKYFTFKNSGKGVDEWPFDQKYHILLNLAVGGNWGGKFGIDERIFPATYKVDYVRVFQK